MIVDKREIILIVEDDEGVAMLEQRALMRRGFDVLSVASAAAALRAIQAHAVDLVVMDYRLPDAVTGFDLLAQFKALGYDPPVIMVTGFSNEATAIEAIHLGVRDFVPKAPEFLDYLPDAVERVFRTIRTERRLAESEAEVRSLNQVLEQRVHERTSQLEQANQELEAFSYSVSHDLRAPLRAINGFANILLNEYSAGYPSEVQEYLHNIRAGATQMGRLIDDLLDFSRLVRKPIDKQSIDPAVLVRECLDVLCAGQTEQRVEPVIGTLATCWGDPALLKQVWMNLLSNALKYTSLSETPAVEIGSSAESAVQEPTYFVRDNGVGFDMRYADKLFGVFQRLPQTEEFDGTGIGLAIVKRIIDRHGGRVWVDAQIGKGATFYFTLPSMGA